MMSGTVTSLKRQCGRKSVSLSVTVIEKNFEVGDGREERSCRSSRKERSCC